MSQICFTCGKGALTGNLRSKSMVAKKTRQKVNLQAQRLGDQRVKMCTSCVKTHLKFPEKFALVQKSASRMTQQRSKRGA